MCIDENFVIILFSSLQLSFLVHPDKNLDDRDRAQVAFDGTYMYINYNHTHSVLPRIMGVAVKSTFNLIVEVKVGGKSSPSVGRTLYT